MLNHLYRLYIDYIYFTFVGLRNLWRWKGIIWYDRQFDHAYLLRILIKKLSLMEESFRNYGHCVGAKKTSLEIRNLKLVIDRIEKDDYTYVIFGKKDYKHPEYLIKQDMEYAIKLINRKLRTWWD